jgi:predicted O-methyltransferase YrrM
MNDNNFYDIPLPYAKIAEATKKLKFGMASDLYTGSLLKTLIASKPGGLFLELGTGSGLATSWIVDGMDEQARLISIDNNELLQAVAQDGLMDKRIQFILQDGYEWIKNYKGQRFDLIFADAMPGKYELFDETIAFLNEGGFYIIDDMLPQANWPKGHADRVAQFIDGLEQRKDMVITKMNWSTGIIIATKVNRT